MLAATTSAFPKVAPQEPAVVSDMLADQAFILPADAHTLLCLLVRDGKPVQHEGCCACVVIDTSAPPYRRPAPKGQIRFIGAHEPVIRVDQVQRALYAVSMR